MPAKKKPKMRDPYAQHAKKRKAGPMKHKNAPKKGAKNKQREILEDEE
jgi:hypothetical protein